MGKKVITIIQSLKKPFNEFYKYLVSREPKGEVVPVLVRTIDPSKEVFHYVNTGQTKANMAVIIDGDSVGKKFWCSSINLHEMSAHEKAIAIRKYSELEKSKKEKK